MTKYGRFTAEVFLYKKLFSSGGKYEKNFKQIVLFLIGASLLGCFNPAGTETPDETEICYVQFSFKAPEAQAKSIGPVSKSTLNDAQSLVISITDDFDGDGSVDVMTYTFIVLPM